VSTLTDQHPIAHGLRGEKRYTPTPEPLSDIDEWIKEISAKWDERLQRLKVLLENEATFLLLLHILVHPPVCGDALGSLALAWSFGRRV
jgi:hypothetical protein